MKLNKNGFVIMEILVYFIIIAFIWFSSYSIMSNLIWKVENKKERNIFFKNYNKFISSILENNDKWWKLNNIQQTWIVLENKWKYIAYACKENGIYKTPISSWNINWETKEKYFSWFNCNKLSWKYNVYSWFFIKVNILKDKEYKYFLKN